MRNHRAILLPVCVLLMLGCSFPLFVPSGQGPIPTAAPTGSATPLLPASPTFTPAPTLSPTPGAPQLTPRSSAVNCRSGPDVAYASLDAINFGQTASIAGRNDDDTWWYVRDPNNASVFCWVSASVATASGNLSNLPVVPAPAVIVTNVTVGASVSFSMCGGPNPVSFSGTITTNGAAKVSFQWEIRGAKSNTTPPQTITFKAAGMKNAPNPGTYTADCGHYSISLHVLSPNDLSAKQNFKIGP
ncbi:MAG TPA: SH3 domain-containing protein [Anaerolineales bacterium]|nr:SH3 domain-containing protein [Anaerolineales bacterium]